MQVFEIFQLTGDYSAGELADLQEIQVMGYRGTIEPECQDDEGYHLMVFTFPRYGLPHRSHDGLRYIWVCDRDICAVAEIS